MECHQSAEQTQNLYGNQVHDMFRLGSLAVYGVYFDLANHTYYPLNPRWPSDGVFPLVFEPGQALDPILYAVGGKQEVSPWLNGSPQSSDSVPGGQITFGGKDTKNCRDDGWVTLEQYTNAFGTMAWCTVLTSVRISGIRGTIEDFGIGIQAKLSIATPFLEAPRVYFEKIITTLGAEYSFKLDKYTVNCGKVSSMPSITFNIAPNPMMLHSYSVSSSHFVVQENTSSGPVCTLLIAQGNNGWVLGSQFLLSRCIHLDFGNGWISFTDPLVKN